MVEYRSIVCPIHIAITLKKVYTNNRCLDNYLNMQVIAFYFYGGGTNVFAQYTL